MALASKIIVSAGEHARSNCPVSAELPYSYNEITAIILTDVKTKKTIPCQVSKSKNGILVTWLVSKMKAGETQKLTAKPISGQEGKPTGKKGIVLEDCVTQSKIDVLVNGELFTSYHYGTEWVRPFLHPIMSPEGVRVTRNWPVIKHVKGETNDHPHHKSVWVSYGDCDGVDNWSEQANHGWQRHQKFLKLVSGPVYGRIVAKNNWCTPKERKQFEEVRDMTFYALPGGTRLFDVAVTFNMTEKNVVFRDTKEGGLISVRVASSMDVPRGGQITNGYGGINERETWGKPAPWCDYSGIVEGKEVGIAIFDNQENPRYPTGWHVRNYGLMTANCFAWKHYRPEAKVKGDMAFKKGSKTTWRYRLYVHNGNAAKGRVAERFMDYAAPPEVTIA